MLNPLKIIFMGTSEFAVPILKKLLLSKFKPFLVITQPDRPSGRNREIKFSPIKRIVMEKKIKILQPANLKEIKIDPDLIITASYGKIIPKNILDLPQYKTINIHPSLLPKYRGPSPIQYAILNKEKESGVSIMLLDEKMDHGPILAQEKIKIGQEETGETLHDKLSLLGSELLIKILPQYLEEKIQIQEQDHSQASYTKLLKKEDGKIDWNKSAEEIDCQIRAFTPWPGTFTFFQGKRLKIIKAKIFDLEKKEAGKTFIQNNQLIINGNIGGLIIERIQLEGKKIISGEEFIKGYPEIKEYTF